MRTIMEWTRVLLFIYYLIRFTFGDKSKNETLWHGIFAIIIMINVVSISFVV